METIYTTKEVSEYLKLSELTVRRYITDGKLKSYKVGRTHRITETALKEYIDTQKNKQTAKRG